MNFNELNPKDVVGERYQIIEKIGNGAFGWTYLATDTKKPSNPQCVIKQLKPVITIESVLQDAQKRFETEAKILERLGKQHDQIPELLAYFKEDQEFFIVQEFIEGIDFKKELKNSKQLNEVEVICLLKNILEVLVFVHEQYVIHRDIKPCNLIRRRSDGKFVLIDFGAVKEITSLSVNSSGQTISTKDIGTLGYIAPEQLKRRPQYNSDIYALGMTAIEALTGRLPIELQEEHPFGEVVWRHQAQVSEKLAEILNKMICYNYKERYQSATEVLNDLQPLTKIGQTLLEQYKIIRYLGGGIFGHTYLAKNQRRPYDPDCIIKQLKPRSTAPSTLRKAQRCFDTEVRVLERLGHHDQIPRLLDHFQENQEFYLVREFIEGEDLCQEITADKRLSEAQVKILLQDVLKVLEFIHNENVIHRDIKPSNLIRRKKDGKIVLIDFGGVKEISALSINSQGQRISTQSLGTEGYMPPEQTAGQPDIRSDFYALGITAIQALTGKSPNTFPKDSQRGEIVWREGTEVSPKLAEVLDKMVRFDFRDRYQSASEILNALGNPGIQPLSFLKKRWQLFVILLTGIILINVLINLPKIIYNQAQDLDNSKKFDKAIELYDLAIKLKPDYYRAWTSRGNTYIELKKFIEAENSCKRATEINEKYSYSWNCLGLALQRQGKNQEAIVAFDKAIKLEPNFKEAWHNKGEALLQLEGREQEAIEAFDEVIRIDKQFFSAWNNRGKASHKLRKYDEAINNFKQSLKINDRYHYAWIGLGKTLRQFDGREEEALNAFNKAIEIEPNAYEAWYGKGAVLNKLNKLQEALAAHEQAIKIEPNYQPSINEIQQLKKKLGIQL
ncbi:MAG: serine/threonine-protein kinase [Phormidium sp.]